MTKVANLPPSSSLTVEQALSHVKKYEDEISEVVITGHYKDGEHFAFSSKMTRRDALWICKMFEKHILAPGG